MKIERVEDNWWVRTEDGFIIDGPFDSEPEARMFISETERLWKRIPGGEHHDDTCENQRG